MISENSEFHTAIEQFQGPLDLLLYLIKESEVDITELPIVTIADQYLEKVEELKSFDPDHASRFLVMAATLIEIKSKTLLPREEVDLSDIEDPRSDLIDQLLAYKQFKEHAKQFELLRHQRLLKFPRGNTWSMENSPESSAVELGDVNTWDLYALFQKIVEETFQGTVPTVLEYNDIPTEVHMKQIISEVIQTPNQSSSFRELVQKIVKDRIQLVGLFIALLELTRLKRVRLAQPKDFSDIHIIGADDLKEDEAPFLEDHQTKHSEKKFNATREENLSESTESISFHFDKPSQNQSLQIEEFYRTNFRHDDGINEATEEDELSEHSISVDVDTETLEIIRLKIPDPILNPTDEELASWRSQNHEGRTSIDSSPSLAE